uniref:Ig-like domain-containing protein n=1 Tax=Macrostomum lignano TaxID=282301 RepID=A0A1I8FC95_9PLAT
GTSQLSIRLEIMSVAYSSEGHLHVRGVLRRSIHRDSPLSPGARVRAAQIRNPGTRRFETSASVGDSVRLRCKAVGMPTPPRLYWLRSAWQQLGYPRLRQTVSACFTCEALTPPSTCLSSSTVRIITRGHVGTYTCSAMNTVKDGTLVAPLFKCTASDTPVPGANWRGHLLRFESEHRHPGFGLQRRLLC